MIKANPHNFTIGSGTQNTYPIVHAGLADTHLLVTPLSASEFLLRNLSGDPSGLILQRKPAHLARVNNFTPFQIGTLRLTLKKLQQTTVLQTQKSNIFEEYVQDYPLQDEHQYLVGVSNICDITLKAPRIAWHAFKFTPPAQIIPITMA